MPARHAALESCGYTRSDALTPARSSAIRSPSSASTRTTCHHVVDLHWKIVNPQVLADSLPFEDLWGHAQPAPALGPAARVPAPVASVALACIHRLAHHRATTG